MALHWSAVRAAPLMSPRQDETSEPLLYARWMAGPYRTKDKLKYQELPIPATPVPAVAGQQVPLETLAAHTAWVKGQKEIAELKTLFSQQAEQELLQTMREFHACKQEEGQSKYDSFVQNYNMHGMEKTVNKLHAMLNLHEQTLPKRDAPALHAIRSGKDYALESVARILNMVPTKKVKKTPYEVWYGQAPKLPYLKVWGCEALVKRDTLTKPDKLEPISIKCIFLGYPKETIGYSFYYPPKNNLFVARNAKFFKNSLITQEASKSLEDLELIHEEDTHPSKNISSHHDEGDQEINEPQSDIILIRRSTRIRHVPDQMCLNIEADEINYEENFSPVADIRAIRILIAMAAFYDYEIWQMDVKTTFLIGYLSEELYMEQPQGFVNLKFTNRVCMLKRSIYGLKQASRQWNKRFDDEIKIFGFTQNHDEPCVYMKASRSYVTFLILYVNDILIMGNNIPMLHDVKSYIGRCFAMKDFRKAEYILGIKIYRDRSKCKSQGASTPAEVKRMQNVPYALAVGSIMYAVRCTRPDVAFAKNITSRFQQNPGELHWTVVKNILKYLTDGDDLKSHTRYVFVLNGCVVDWKSTKQSIFVTSSTEAEYIAALDASKEAVWVRKFISGLGVVTTIEQPIKMYCDNTRAITIANESGITKDDRHYRAKVYYLREVIEFGYPKETIGYSFYYPPKNNLFVARNAKFFKNSLITQEASKSLEDLELIQEEDTHPSKSISSYHDEGDQEIDEPQSDIILIRRSTRTRHAPDQMCLNIKADEINYEEKFSPVADIRAIRILIAMAAFYDYEIWQMDVKTTFLIGYLSEEIYMEQPQENLEKIFHGEFQTWKYPMQEKLKLSKSQGASTPVEVKRMQNVPYALAVGSIMFAVRCTRPDVGFAKNITSRFQQNPGELHWTAVKNILKYLRNTKDTFLFYEAEYIAALDASKEAVWVRKFISGLGVVTTIEQPIKMYCDNTGAITIANESGFTKDDRHYRAKVHYLREVIEFGPAIHLAYNKCSLVSSCLGLINGAAPTPDQCSAISSPLLVARTTTLPLRGAALTPDQCSAISSPLLIARTTPLLLGLNDNLLDGQTRMNVESCCWKFSAIMGIGSYLEMGLKAKYMAEDASSKKFLVSNFTNYKLTDSRLVMEQYNELGSHTKDELTLIELGSHLRIEESLRAQDSDKPKGNKKYFVTFIDDASSPRPSRRIPNGTKDIGGLVVPEEATEEVAQQPEPNLRKSKRNKTSKNFGPESTNDEMDSIMGNNTWVLADLPLGCKPLGYKWIFKRKLKVNRTIEMFKARLVIQGFKQKSGIDYFNTYAPVARISTIRILIAMALIYNPIIDHMDVKTTFFNGELDDEVYMNQPQGFIMPGNENKVDLTKEFLSLRFSMKDMGDIDVIFSIRIKHESNRIAIFQSHYIKKVLKKSIYFDCTPVSTLMDTSEKLMPNNGQVLSQLEYSRVISCLMYTMTSTRPVIVFAVGKLSRYTSNPCTQHWQAIQRDTLMQAGLAILKTIHLPVARYSCLVEVPFLRLPRNKLASLAKDYSQMYNGKSRHLGVRHSMIRELITNGVISIEFVRSQQNLADHLTRGLARDMVIKSAEGMGLKSN
nr:retrovirus-related Pol polyprotein from transposon TNT 1-94 [Tanacetum cinerariifolium]